MTKNDDKAVLLFTRLGIGVEISQEAIAPLCGLTPEQAERVADRLEARGLIYRRRFYDGNYLSARPALITRRGLTSATYFPNHDRTAEVA